MKYTGYTKKELLEVIECLEHNYKVVSNQNANQFYMLKVLQEKLDIALDALEEIYRVDEGNSYFIAEEALGKIKEIK